LELELLLLLLLRGRHRLGDRGGVGGPHGVCAV
jgi:hypothetical protein